MPAMKLDAADKSLIALVTALLAGLFGYAASLYARLPERLPIHFNAAGVADGFAPKSWGAWLLLPCAMSLVCVVSVVAGLAIMGTDLRWVNIPHKQEFLALPRHVQEPILRGFVRIMIGSGVVWAVFGFTMVSQVARVAMGRADRFNPVPLGVLVAVVLLVLLGGTVRMSRRIRAAVDAAARAVPGPHARSAPPVTAGLEDVLALPVVHVQQVPLSRGATGFVG